MTTLSKDEVVRLAREAGYRADAKMHDHDYDLFLNFYTLCRAPLVAENAALKQAHEINADTLNAMQVEIDDWKARALKAEQVGEPVAYIAWKNDKPCYEGDDAICEDAVWPVDSDDYRTSMPVFTAPQPAAQEPDCATTGVCVRSGLYASPPSAVPVVEQLVEALEAVEVLIEHQYTGTRDGMNALQNAADDAHDALKIGQQFLKEQS